MRKPKSILGMKKTQKAALKVTEFLLKRVAKHVHFISWSVFCVYACGN